MDPEQFYRYIDGIQAIVHSHTELCSPSEEDLENMKVWRIPWIIASKSCIAAYLVTDVGVTQISIDPLFLEELKDFVMHLP